jgi:glycosyltransferase involved in cell wall biosynthesis
METFRIAILIPAFNEERTIGSVIEGALRFGDVFVSDDGSTDQTAEVAWRSGATVLSQGGNRGYNSALNFGYQSILSKGFSGIVTIDADGQHDPDEVHLFVAGLLDGFDVVVGIRPKKARLMESVFGAITNSLWGVKDPLCGMKGYSAQILRDKGSIGTYNSVGTEVLMFSLASKAKVTSISITGLDRQGSSRFAGKLRANFLIGMSLLSALGRIHFWSAARK